MNERPTRLIDANIILRFLRKDDPALSARAKELFSQSRDGKFYCYIDEVTVAETIWVLTSVYKTQRADIASLLEAFFLHIWIINPRKTTILRAISFYRMSTLHYIDCWLLAVSEEMHFSLETFDSKLRKHKKKGSPL